MNQLFKIENAQIFRNTISFSGKRYIIPKMTKVMVSLRKAYIFFQKGDYFSLWDWERDYSLLKPISSRI